MKYHNITHDDMLNGDGLRVVLWVSGCNHRCDECHNPVTWDSESGLDFADQDRQELWDYLGKSYTTGITFSGGDPFYPNNREAIGQLIVESKSRYPDKTIWVYTGYLWDEVKDLHAMRYIDVLVDGEYKKELNHKNIHWCGSTNQRVIDVPKSLALDTVVLWREP